MRAIRIVGLALAAVVALGAAAASASAAEPEFKFTQFPDSNTMSSGEVTLQTRAGRTVKCSASTASDELYSFTEIAKVSVKLTGCKQKTSLGEASCKSSGASAEEVVLNPMRARLVYVNKVTKETGLHFKPEVEGLVAEFNCDSGLISNTLRIKGSVVGMITPINIATTKFTIAFKQTGGVQEQTEYEEGGVKHTATLEIEGKGTEPFAYEQAGEGAIDAMTWAATAEVKA